MAPQVNFSTLEGDLAFDENGVRLLDVAVGNLKPDTGYAIRDISGQ